MAEKKLEVKHLQISFRTQNGTVKAVRDISFDLYKGETLAIVGESGSGKSVTSKAIIGILANNSIVEGGEILYDGHDLLKISEEYFHKIRGDKIAMIFQDPMSSLNPIVTVGKQLTEAMLLKGKTSQKESRKNFNEKLKLLNHFMDLAEEGKNEEHKKYCETFDKFCIKANQLENIYNQASEFAVQTILDIDNFLFLIEKNQKLDLGPAARKIRVEFVKTYVPHLVIENEETDSLVEKLRKTGNSSDRNEFAKTISRVKEIVVEAQNKTKVDYFSLGYYLLKNPEYDYKNVDEKELNELTFKALTSEFLDDFTVLAEKGVALSHSSSIESKKETLKGIASAKEYFSKETIEIAESKKIANELAKDVENSIDLLDTRKESSEYCFKLSINHAIDTYFNGVVNNPKAEKKYEKDLAKYNGLVEKGKQPTWKVIPPTLVDLELAKSNIVKILEALEKYYNKAIEKSEKYDPKKVTQGLVAFFKDQASKVVYRVTKSMAKAKALKLLEEVGIPEPAIRYKQYPFEFSGGMRQRIVIAIALSANPDILICDEPTTALDVTIQSQILELINNIKKERNLSVIFITHDLGVVAMMADRIAVMYAGKIVEYGTSEDIFYDPKHPYTWALLSSMPDLDTKEKLEAIPGTPPNMIFPPKGDAFAERNKYALEIDYELQPPLFEVSKTHYAATWLLHPNAPKINPPKVILERIERMKKKVNEDGKQ